MLGAHAPTLRISALCLRSLGWGGYWGPTLKSPERPPWSKGPLGFFECFLGGTGGVEIGNVFLKKLGSDLVVQSSRSSGHGPRDLKVGFSCFFGSSSKSLQNVQKMCRKASEIIEKSTEHHPKPKKTNGFLPTTLKIIRKSRKKHQKTNQKKEGWGPLGPPGPPSLFWLVF